MAGQTFTVSMVYSCDSNETHTEEAQKEVVSSKGLLTVPYTLYNHV